MFDIEIKDYKYRSRCDMRCTNPAKRSVNTPGQSAALSHNYCDEHLKQLIEKGIQLYLELEGEEYKKKILSVVLGGNVTIEHEMNDLKFKVEQLTKELETKQATIELLEEKIADMRVANKSNKNTQKKVNKK